MPIATLRKCVIVERPAPPDTVIIARDLLNGATRRVTLRGKQRLLVSRFAVGDEIYARGFDEEWRLVTITDLKRDPELGEGKDAIEALLARRGR